MESDLLRPGSELLDQRAVLPSGRIVQLSSGDVRKEIS